ncbi:hypothetical protein GCM10010416_32020 [Streptomyces caniferus]
MVIGGWASAWWAAVGTVDVMGGGLLADRAAQAGQGGPDGPACGGSGGGGEVQVSGPYNSGLRSCR